MDQLARVNDALALHANDAAKLAAQAMLGKRDRELAEAKGFMEAEGTADARRAQARLAAGLVGVEAEGAWEGKRAVMRLLETQAMVLTALLKSMGRS